METQETESLVAQNVEAGVDANAEDEPEPEPEPDWGDAFAESGDTVDEETQANYKAE